ncbi:MAG TPA: cytochrome c oxidase subunit 3 [bacterium]|nr:cytochrome c oxidase subunit 3 [bacterium]
MTGAVDARERGDLATRWSGGRSPWDVSWGKLMMWLFLISDAMTFAALLIGLWVERLGSPTWPNRLEIINLRFVATMTVILIFSSTTMALAVYAIRQGARRQAVWFLTATIAAGCVFAGMQATEWLHFIGEGARLTGNPWGVPAFSFTFFVITGLHGAHVLGGVVYLWIMADRIARGLSSAEGVEIAGLYWGFVDLGWVFIWSSIYLL